MSSWVRTFVIWLLVLALPVQGAAAATMAMCNPHQHGSAGAAPHEGRAQAGLPSPAPHSLHAHPSGSYAADAGHVHPAQGGHEHPGQAVDLASADAGSSPVATPGDAPAVKISHGDQHNCSACAACCSAAAFSSQVVKVPAPQVGRTVFSSLVPTVARFAAGGPDRPPRLLVA